MTDRFDYASLARQGHALLEPVVRSFGGTATGGLFSRMLGQAMRLSETARLVKPLAQSPIIYSCTRVNADALAGVPLLVRESDDEDAEVVEDELGALLSKPNPLMSRKKLMRAVSMSLDLSGGVYFFLAQKGGDPISPGQMPAEIWPIRDDLVEPIFETNANGQRVSLTPIAYEARSGSSVVSFKPHAVAHVYYPDPDDMFRGFGPMQAIWRSADHLFRAEAFDDGLVENGGQMGGFFVHEDQKLDPKQRDSLQKSVDQNAATPRKDRRKLVLPSGIKFVPTTYTPVDMQAKDLRSEKRKEIMRAFGVFPVMLGELEDANRSSLREQRRVYYELTVATRCEFVMDEMNEQLVSKLPGGLSQRHVQLDYANTPPMREDLDSRIDRMRKLVDMAIPVADAARMSGVDQVEIPDRFVGAGLTPYEIANTPPQPPPEIGDDEDEPEPEDDEEERALIEVTPPPASTASDDKPRRAAAVEAEKKRGAKSELRVKRAARRVFDDYILAQRKKIRSIAASDGGKARAPKPWSWYTESAGWSDSTREYARLLNYEPKTGAEGWVEVRGLSEDELAQIILGAEAEWGAQLWGALHGPLKNAIEDAAKATHASVGGRLVTAADPDILRFFAAKEINVVEGPMSVVAEQVKRALIEGMADVTSGGTLAERVREALESIEDELRVMQDRLGTRAALIARTESASASSAGRTAQYEAAGITQHEWASAGDDIVRDGHDIDGEVAVVGTPFSNGLRYPGDPTAPIGMIANCRCVTVPVTS